MLQMSFRNLRFSRCLFCCSVSITKRANFLFSLYVPFHIDTFTLVNVGISCCFLHKRNVSNQFFKLSFLLFKISNNFNQIMPILLLLNMFENIISSMQLSNENYHQKLNHFKKPRKMTNDFFSHYIFICTFRQTSLECLINVTIMVKVAMVTYIHCENG